MTFDNGASDAAINVSGSGHNITSQVGVMLNSDLDIAVNSSSDTLAIAGNITEGSNGHVNLTKSGAGKLTLSGINTYGGDTAVTGGVLKVTSASAVPDGGNLEIGADGADHVLQTVRRHGCGCFRSNQGGQLHIGQRDAGGAASVVPSAPQAASPPIRLLTRLPQPFHHNLGSANLRQRQLQACRTSV